MMDDTFKSLIKMTGKVLFIIGLVLNICMVFFGIWPSLIYLLIMLFGAGIVLFTGKLEKSSFKYTPEIKKMTNIIFITCAGIIFIITIIFILSKDYVKKKNTLRDCEEIAIALKQYKESANSYPINLTVLTKGNPLRSAWNKDKWGNLYEYKLINHGNSYLLISAGADNKFDTKDDLIFKGN